MGGKPAGGSEGFTLALDTSGSRGSVAVGAGEETLASVSLDQALEQASLLVPAIDRALREAGLGRAAVADVLVGEGPGSFTGVRVAAATAKGLAHALGVPLRAVSSLAAAALATDAGPIRYVLFDARGERVYGACYGVGSAGVQELVAPHGGTLRDALDRDVPGGAVFVGEGALAHRAAIEGAGYDVMSADESTGLAEGLLRYLAAEPETPPVDSLGPWEPRYVRASSAERLWTA